MMKKKKKNFKFKNADNVQYEVVFRKPNKNAYGEDCDGVCHSPSLPNPKIQINPHRTEQTQLNTAIHEFAHAFFCDKPEKDIKKFSDSVSRFLFNEKKWRKPKA